MSMPQRPTVPRDDVRLDELSPAPRRAAGRGGLSRTAVAVSVGLALLIVASAWLAGGRIGLSDIGQGGVSRQYLPKIGQQAPSLGMFGPNNQQVFLSQFRGQSVWINFWGSWCPPCRAEFPEIERAYRALQPQGVVLLAISARESWDSADEFAVANGGTFPVYNIPDLSIFGTTWDARNFPTHIYIDPTGVIRYISTSQGRAPDLIARGEWLLAGNYASDAPVPPTVVTSAIRREDG